MLNLRNSILLSMMMLVHKCNSEAFLPLFPCYSVHKIQTDHNSVHYYRFVENHVLPLGESGMECMFTIEGPPGSKLQLQLFDVVLQRPGYVSTSLGNDNCSLGLVQIYNLTSNGALVLAQKVCGSFMEGPVILSDTNVAVVTTAAQGQFDLHVTILQQNIKPTFQPHNIQDMDKTRFITLGNKQTLTEDLDKPPQKQELHPFEKHLDNNIKNVSISALKASHTINKNENQETESMGKVDEASIDPEDDTENYTENDDEYELDQNSHIQEEPSDSQEKLPLEKLFELLRENSKYSDINYSKRVTDKKRKQTVHKTKYHSETTTSPAPKSSKNATKTKSINLSTNN